MDAELRELERQLKVSPDDERLKVRYEQALLRSNKDAASVITPKILEAIAVAINRKFVEQASVTVVAEKISRFLRPLGRWNDDYVDHEDDIRWSRKGLRVWGRKSETSRLKTADLTSVIAADDTSLYLAIKEVQNPWLNNAYRDLDHWRFNASERLTMRQWLDKHEDEVLKFDLKLIDEWLTRIFKAPESEREKLVRTRYTRASSDYYKRPVMPGNSKYRRRKRHYR